MLEAADRLVERGDVDATGGRAQPLEHAFLVALGLQATDEPAAGVRHCLVVEVDGVLRRDDHADPEGACLLHQGQDRLLGRRGRGGRREAEDLVEVDERAQVARPGLTVHPREQAGEDERDDELALLLGEVREVDDRGPGLSLGREEQRAGVDRGAAAPGGERRRRDQRVQADRKLAALLGRHERIDVEDTELPHRRRLDLADQRRQVEIPPGAPVVLDQVRDQHVLAAPERVGVDADEAE